MEKSKHLNMTALLDTYNMKEILKFLTQYIRKHYGKRCKDFEINCSVCQQYLALDILIENLELEELDGKGAI